MIHFNLSGGAELLTLLGVLLRKNHLGCHQGFFLEV